MQCYEIQGSGSSAEFVARGSIRHEAPVMCVDIGSDNYSVYSAGCDGMVRMWDVKHGATAEAESIIGRKPNRILTDASL